MTDATLVTEHAELSGVDTAVTGRHLPALNGLRGLAVLGVVAYHLQLGWASGGYLGVDLFFVLSGFLITTLLLEEWVGSGRINLAAFWGRRARRLLPALFLVVAALALYLVCDAVFGGPGANGLVDLSGLRGDAIATLLYVNNWHLIYAHQSYFAQFSTPSPLQHTWSLAIEEQFYLVWPLVLLVLLRFGRQTWRGTGLAVAVSLGVLSSMLMAVLFQPGTDPSRIYFGTDTRLFDLMAGATIAFIAAARRSRTCGRAGRSTSWDRSPPWCSGCSGSPPARPVACRPTSCSRAGSCSAPCWPDSWWPTPGSSNPGGSPVASPGRRCTSSAPSRMASTCGTGRSSCTSTGPARASRRGPSTSCVSR